jgi:hypothetical protein
MPAIAVQQLYWLSRRTSDGWVRLTCKQWGVELGCDGSTASRTFAGLAECALVDVDKSGERWGYRPRYRELLALMPGQTLSPKAVEAALGLVADRNAGSLQIATPVPPGERDCASVGTPSRARDGRTESTTEERQQRRETATTHVTELGDAAREPGPNGGSGEESEHDVAQVEAALAASMRSPERRGGAR